MTDPLLAEYEKRYQKILVPTAQNLERLMINHLKDAIHVDRVTARAKGPKSFIEKAYRVDSDGQPRYKAPLVQIQDQIGARAVVFYKADVDPVSDLLMKYFRPVEIRVVVPDSEWEFGYFGKHHILVLPGDVIPREIDPTSVPCFFELQIKTLFQHAWSEANHDLGYKQVTALNADQTRRLAFTAAQAWGADRVFYELAKELGVG